MDQWRGGDFVCGVYRVGVGAIGEPVTIDDVLASFDASVADGSLVGNGPGVSMENRQPPCLMPTFDSNPQLVTGPNCRKSVGDTKVNTGDTRYRGRIAKS